MPLDTEKTIGSHGLEQGGANLGNDYTTSTPHVEQNQTTNIGKKGTTTDNDNSNARHDLTSGYTPEQLEEIKRQEQEKSNK